MKLSHYFRSIILFSMLTFIASMVRAEEIKKLDPLLRLLVKKGVISREEALDLEKEYEAMKEAEKAEVPESTGTKGISETAEPEPGWTDRFDVKGDIRLRYEGFSQKDNFDDDRRDRFRIRLRAGFEAAVTDWMRVGVELRNGDPADPVSNNTSFDGGFQFKDINLAEVYLQIRPQENFGLIAGKFDAHHWWTVSDFQWDDDVTVEGMMTNADLFSGTSVFRKLDLVAYTFLLEERKNERDANLYGGQLRSTFRFGETDTINFGAGFDAWKNPQHLVDLTLGGQLKGNHVTNFLNSDGELISDFEILNFFAGYKNSRNSRWPLTFSLFYYKNLGADGIGADNDTAYFFRAQIGDYKKRGQLAFRYSYYYSEPDALFYVFTQSDTSRGSDAEAHRFDLRLGFIARSYFNLTWYNTRPVYSEDETINRWQMDYIVKF